MKPGAFSRKLARDVILESDGSVIRVANDHLSLTFDRGSGRWLSLQGSRPLTCSSPGTLGFFVAGKTSHYPWDSSSGSYLPGERGSYVENAVLLGSATTLTEVSHQLRGGAVEVRLQLREGDFLLEDRYTLWPGKPLFTRQVILCNGSEETLRVRFLELLLPGIEMQRGDTFEAPGFAVVPHTPVEQLPRGRWSEKVVAEQGKDGLMFFEADFGFGCVGLGKTQLDLYLLALGYSEEEILAVDTSYDGKQLQLLHRFQCAALLQPDEVMSVGRQIVCLAPGTLETALSALKPHYPELGIAVPQTTPSWMKQLIIYEAHVGPKFMDPFLPEEINVYQPYPTLEKLIDDLQRIRRLGFDTLQLMPRFPFPGYTVHDYLDLDTHYGGEKELRALTERAHKLGMRVILDVILHGCVDRERRRYAKWAAETSPYLRDHPEWFMRTEDGEVAITFTYAFDLANREWQDYFIRVMRYYLQEIGVDGFRIDAPTWNNFPNWDPTIPYRAGSSAMGAMSLFRRARQALDDLGREIIFYTEPGGPALRTIFDISYSYDELWLLGSLVEPTSDKYGSKPNALGQHITAGEMREWYRYKQLAYPDDSFERTVRHIDSHDSFEWKCLGQFKREAFGLPAARAMFVCNALLKGGILNFVGGETGSEEFYRQVLALRHHPAFRRGRMDFNASTCDDDMVFHLLHRQRDDSLLVIVNFATERRRCRLIISGLAESITPGVALGEAAHLEARVAPGGKVELFCDLAPFETMVLKL